MSITVSACDEYAGHSLTELVQLFDSAYVSFYKGLGGVTGAMLLASHATIACAKIWLRRFGGNVYSLMPYAVSCQSGFRANRLSFPARLQHMQLVVGAVSAALATGGDELQGLVRFEPLVPVVSLIHVYIKVR